MPMYRNPKFAYVEPGGGGAGGVLLAAGMIVVAAGAGAVWLAREVARMWVEIAVIAGGTTVFVVAGSVYLAVKFNRGSLPVNAAAKAETIASARAAKPAGETHYHTHYEEHHHLHQAPAAEQHVHLHQAPPAAEPRPAIAARNVVPGVVLGATPEAIEARKAPLYRINASEHAAIEDKKR